MKKKLLRIPDTMMAKIEAIRIQEYWEGATSQQVIIDLLARGLAWHAKRASNLKAAALDIEEPKPNTTDQNQNNLTPEDKRNIEIAKTKVPY